MAAKHKSALSFFRWQGPPVFFPARSRTVARGTADSGLVDLYVFAVGVIREAGGCLMFLLALAADVEDQLI